MQENDISKKGGPEPPPPKPRFATKPTPPPPPTPQFATKPDTVDREITRTKLDVLKIQCFNLWRDIERSKKEQQEMIQEFNKLSVEIEKLEKYSD